MIKYKGDQKFIHIMCHNEEETKKISENILLMNMKNMIVSYYSIIVNKV